MNFEISSRPTGAAYEKWRKLLSDSGLVAEGDIERTLLVYDEEEIVATGSRDGCVLKLIAVADSHRGEDLTASVLTELRRDAFESGYDHLFLYTKPQNKYMFESLFFYSIAETDDVLVMENKKGGLTEFLDRLPKVNPEESVGALVMNCNPFTLGHRALVEYACAECDRVFVFVLSEDKSEFSFKDRIEMVKRGTADLKNVTVLSTGQYLLSSATFPTYFIKDRDKAELVSCEVDIDIFAKHFAKRLMISRRYVGSEPNSALTNAYNVRLLKKLPEFGIDVRVLDRIQSEGEPISASVVRSHIKSGNREAISRLVPKTTLDYLLEKEFI